MVATTSPPKPLKTAWGRWATASTFPPPLPPQLLSLLLLLLLEEEEKGWTRKTEALFWGQRSSSAVAPSNSFPSWAPPDREERHHHHHQLPEEEARPFAPLDPPAQPNCLSLYLSTPLTSQDSETVRSSLALATPPPPPPPQPWPPFWLLPHQGGRQPVLLLPGTNLHQVQGFHGQLLLSFLHRLGGGSFSSASKRVATSLLLGR